MKKILLGLVTSSLLLTSLYASNKDVDKGISLGTSKSTYTFNGVELDSTEYQFGIVFAEYYKSNIMFGIENNYSWGSLDTETSEGDIGIGTIGVDFKLGYQLFNSLTIYGLGSFVGQYVDGGDNGWGYGYGTGAEYKLTKRFTLDFNYKSYDMTNSTEDYDLDKMTANLKINF